MRHKSDKKWRGEYHTPACVTDLMARILVDKDVGGEGKSIREPAVGSGTMFRSVAQRLRDLKLNPHDYTWYGNDIDTLAAACAAVNTIIRGLGPQALIGATSQGRHQDVGRGAGGVGGGVRRHPAGAVGTVGRATMPPPRGGDDQRLSGRR
ncbi:N-6 DNA methylase [Streptomyces sp. NPDC054765]